MGNMINLELIKKRRKELNLSQTRAAELVSEAQGRRLSQQGYQKIEQGGSPNSSSIPFICAVLDLPYEKVTGRENPMASYDGHTLFGILQSLPKSEQATFLKLLAADAYKGD